ncbi:uncharacterized protein LOC111397648 [Olea europaea var. sylvestris]|uniref:Uncharacterized protein n=1 Tax=Olea europaea subsp. europaea TaxID=158383 RepID=A0A8S0TBD9_OLEEU|nr:uncharacterized protein LOC111397648 [Olea europaea var. sylvestris]CAA3001323.1 Hypothetical predicted protein [Olea europaea subsp. europaea]
MAAVLEVEDDVFFADLSHQISLLLMDDDEESLSHCSSVNSQASTQAIASATQTSYDQTSRRGSKGTGVFIPRSLHYTRNKRQGRYTANSRINFQRDSDSSRGLRHVANYTNKNSMYDPFYRIRF